jgi:hypothetical protein
MLRYNGKVLTFFKKLKTYYHPRFNNGIYGVCGLIRTSTKRSMRKRVGPSQAPFPPHAHAAGSSGLRAIKFDVDRSRNSGLIGPVKFPGSNFFNEPIPHMHEFGGLYFHRGRGYSYPERSYMWSTTKKLIAQGRIPRRFAVSMGEII